MAQNINKAEAEKMLKFILVLAVAKIIVKYWIKCISKNNIKLKNFFLFFQGDKDSKDKYFIKKVLPYGFLYCLGIVYWMGKGSDKLFLTSLYLMIYHGFEFFVFSLWFMLRIRTVSLNNIDDPLRFDRFFLEGLII